MNVSQVEQRGGEPLREVIKKVGGWPILDAQWSSQGFVLEQVLGRMRKLYGSFLWNCGVGADDKNSAVNIIQIDQIALGMPSREYYLMDEHSYHLEAYRNLIVLVVRLLGVDEPRVQRDVDEILAFEKQLANFNMLSYLREFIMDDITEEEPIVLFATQYIQDVVSIIDRTDKRIVSNYVVWRLIMDMVPELASPFQAAMTEYKAVLQGMNREQVRWKKCVEFVNDRVGMAVGAMFVKNNFKKESRDTVTFTIDQFFENILRLKKFDSNRMMAKLRQPIDQDMWDQEPVTVNAFYNPNTNDIVLPAGILQPLFYSASFPKSLNYGGIGVVIGHEITHGFDDKGRQYDKDGNIKQWWDDHTSQAFNNRSQCMIDQYSNFKLEQIDQFIWCGKMRDEEALRKIRISAHSLGPIRVFGPLSNSKEFSEAYSCPLGSRMNPHHKCSVW
ncbi:hypothetical protein EGW08_013165 [Elysia chlorotica]|uniref:Peptidase M13 C-terminal domain-containing protein n=1 Tax=Elysia chlorotica TaxID=188477 RepID=A0A3S0ZHL1_ELYCH|nr:hypothetical protein EGW08_013165 [Elysia chlorotica]